MKLQDLDVTVVGGAIGGASAALLLARAGARVTLLERAERARAVGAGIALAENGIAVLTALGFGPALERIGASVSGVRVVDAHERTLFVPKGIDDDHPPRLLMVRRSELYALLNQALGSEPRITTRYGAVVRAASEDGVVTFEQAGGAHALRAELVIGADGVHSQVRESGAFGARVERSGITYARGLAAAGLARGEEAWTSAGLFGSFPLPGATYWYASLGTAPLRAAVAARDLSALCAAWQKAYPPAASLLGELKSFDDVLVNEVIRVRCRSFVSGRRVLLGDAAHAMAPNLGQGANSALVDAAVLAEELARSESLEAALASYDARRRPKVERVATTAARLGTLAELTHPIARFVRDRLLMPLASASDPGEQLRVVLQEEPAQLAALGRVRAS